MRAEVGRVLRAGVAVDGKIVGAGMLYGDARTGRRPTWQAAAPEPATP